MGTLLRRCVEVHTAIELSFGVVSGVGPGIHVLHGSPRASRGRSCCFWHGFWHFFGVFVQYFTMEHTDTLTYRSIIDSCVKNWQYFRTDGIPLNSVSNSLSSDLVRFKIEVGVDAKCTLATSWALCDALF